MKKPVVLVPSYKGIDRDVEANLRELERRGYHVVRYFGPATIDRTRSMLAQHALDAGHDPLVWIDDDIVFNPDDVERFMACDEDFVAGAFAQREAGGSMVVGNRGDLILGAGGELVEVDWVGFGFVLTTAYVFEQVGAKLDWCDGEDGRRFKPYFAPLVEPPDYYGEDISFCHRATRAGVTIYCDTSVRLLHVGRRLYGWEDTLPLVRVPTMLAQSRGTK